MYNKIRLLYTGAAILLLLVLYYVIFSFSAQDAETSGTLSLKISRLGVEWWSSLTGGAWSELVIQRLAAYFEHPIRKLAHFAEYAAMGFLIHSIWVIWKKRDMRWVFYSLIWVFVSAAADEFHQYFVPGRSGNLADVILDTCGGLAGIWMIRAFCAR